MQCVFCAFKGIPQAAASGVGARRVARAHDGVFVPGFVVAVVDINTLGVDDDYYYREKALGHITQEVGKLILKIDALPADKKATFFIEEISLMRKTINGLRNERLAKGQYTDAADDMLLKLY